MHLRKTGLGVLGAAVVSAAATFALPAYAEGESVVLVAAAPAGDRGPIDGLISGLEQVEEEFGVKTRHIESLDPGTFENQLRTIARRGTDIVIATFFVMGPAVASVAPDFPDTKFILIVSGPFDPPLPNARGIGYATHENAYLAGIFGAHMTESKTIGMVGGAPLPVSAAEYNAMNAAVASVDPSIEITQAFVGSFNDPVKGKEVAAGLYAQGIDTIYTTASTSDIGVVEGADEADQLVLVASPALMDNAPDNVGFAASFEWAQTVRLEVANALGDFDTTYRVGGIASGEIIPSFSEPYIAGAEGSEKAREAVMSAFEAIRTGEFTVPFDLTEPAN